MICPSPHKVVESDPLGTVFEGSDGRFYFAASGRPDECTSAYPDIEGGRRSLALAREFWADKVSVKDEPTTVRVEGHHYRIAPEAQRGMRGFDGAKWTIEFLDGRRVVSTNLWSNGDIPAALRELLPDNARFVKEGR